MPKIPKPDPGQEIISWPTLPLAETEITSKQAYQWPKLKEIAQTVTVNDFYFKKMK